MVSSVKVAHADQFAPLTQIATRMRFVRRDFASQSAEMMEIVEVDKFAMESLVSQDVDRIKLALTRRFAQATSVWTRAALLSSVEQIPSALLETMKSPANVWTDLLEIHELDVDLHKFLVVRTKLVLHQQLAWEARAYQFAQGNFLRFVCSEIVMNVF